MTVATHFITAADHYLTAQMARKWDAYTQVGTSGILTIQPNQGRNGRAAFRFERAGNSTNRAYLIKHFTASTQWVVGFMFRFNQFPDVEVPIMRIHEGAISHMQLTLHTDGVIEVNRATTIAVTGGESSISLTPDIDYHIELKITIADSISADTCVVRINQVEAINVDAGEDLQNAGTGSADRVYMGNPSTTSPLGTGFQYFFYDVVIRNGVTNLLGDLKVETLFPSADGDLTDFTPSAGDNFENVDAASPDDDTTYNSSATAGHQDSCELDNITGNIESVHAVQIMSAMKTIDAAARTGTIFALIDSTVYDGDTPFDIPPGYLYARDIWTEDPDAAGPWTRQVINAMQAGYELTT